MNKKHIFVVFGIVCMTAAIVTAIIMHRPNVDACASAIPRDAKAIARVDLRQFVREADLSAADELQLLRRLLATDSDQRVGVDLASPAFAFVDSNGDMGVVVRIDDAKMLRQTFATLHAQGKVTALTPQRDLEWTVIDGRWLVVFDDEKLLVMGPAIGSTQDYLRSTMALLMRQKADASAMTMPLYCELADCSAPVAAVCRGDLLPQSFQAPLHQRFHVRNVSDLHLAAEMHTLANEITLDLSFTSSDPDFHETLDEIGDLLKPIEADLVPYAGASPLLWTTANVDGDDVLELLRSFPDVRVLLVMLNTIVNADAIIDDVDGDISIEIPAASPTGRGLPDITLLARLDDEADSFREAPYWLSSAAALAGYELTQRSPTDFRLRAEGADLCFGMSDGLFYLSTSDSHAMIPDKKLVQGYIADRVSDIRGKRFYATLDITALGPNILASLPGAASLLGRMQRAEMYMPDVNRFHLSIIAPEGTNVARTLIFSVLEQ